jgi:hypothetical protein
MVQRRSFTQSVPLPKNTEFTVEVSADQGYDPGRSNVSQGIITQDILIQATPAIPKECIVTALSTDNQDIMLNIYNATGTAITRIYTNPKSVSLPYNTIYSVTLLAHEGYTKSNLINIIEGEKYHLTRNLTISTDTDAIVVQCEIVLLPTEHQTVSVNTNNGLYIESDRDDEVRVVSPYWTKYTCSVTADPGYNPGYIDTIEQTITKNAPNFTPFHPEDPDDESGYVTVQAASATENKHKVSIYKYDHQKIYFKYEFNDEIHILSVDSPNPVVTTPTYNTYEVFDSSIYSVSIVPDPGYRSIYPVISYIENRVIHKIDVPDPTQEFVLDRNIDITSYENKDASIDYHTITLIQSKNQTMYLSSGEYEDITGSVNLKHNSPFTIRVVVSDPIHYNAGDVISSSDDLTIVSQNVYRGTITNDNMIYITPATVKSV